VNDGLRAAMIFGQTGTTIINTAIIGVMGVVAIVIGSLVSRWEED
jgi:hypothetical protein